MIVDKNKIIPFKKYPWNPLCKNGISLKIPILSKPNFKTNFSIKYYNSIISVQSIVFKCAEIISYAINKFGRFYGVTEKIVVFKKIKNYKI